MRSLGECTLGCCFFYKRKMVVVRRHPWLSLVFTALLCGIPICKQPSHRPPVGISLSVPCMSLLTLLALPEIPVSTLCQDGKFIWTPQAEPPSFPDLLLHQVERAAPPCVTLILLPQFPEESRCSLRKLSPVPRTQRRLGPGSGHRERHNLPGLSWPRGHSLTLLLRLLSEGAFPVSLLRLLQTMCLCHQRRKMWEREWNEKIDNWKKMI